MLILFLIENHTNGCTVVSVRIRNVSATNIFKKTNQFVGTTNRIL